eukprot:UN24319
MMNFTLREMVVLNGGGHSIGKCHSAVSGYEGQWSSRPTEFDNSWFKQVLEVQDALGALGRKVGEENFENGRSQWVRKREISHLLLCCCIQTWRIQRTPFFERLLLIMQEIMTDFYVTSETLG